MRSSRCSSNEKPSSEDSSSNSPSSATPESTSSFWWQRPQYSCSSGLWVPQTWQNIGYGILRRVLVEAPPRLPAQPAGVHHLDQQRTGAVLGIAEALLEDAHDVEAHVEADQVGQRQRSHRMAHPQLHHLVDRLGAADALEQAVDRLVDQR